LGSEQPRAGGVRERGTPVGWDGMEMKSRAQAQASRRENLGALLFRIPPVLIAEPKKIGRS
jgi:hypothetical protein